MADEAQYSSGNESTPLKRKYEYDDQSPAATHRPTGFSSAAAAAPPPSYNSVAPPPASGIELAKQRAQEVAARLLSGAPPLEAKRPKVDNGAPPPSSFDSPGKQSNTSFHARVLVYTELCDVGEDADGKPQYSAPSAAPVSYGHQGTSKKIDIPNGRVGVIIGKGGETIKYLQLQSGAKIQVTRDMDADPNSPTRMVELMGTSEAIAAAEKLINEVLAEVLIDCPRIVKLR